MEGGGESEKGGDIDIIEEKVCRRKKFGKDKDGVKAHLGGERWPRKKTCEKKQEGGDEKKKERESGAKGREEERE